MYNALHRTGEINRLRRNKLLLTDWSGSRPWKQLYMMFDTSAEGQPDLANLVDKFWEKLERIQRNVPLAERNNPSNRGNIWSRLFPIHPLASSDASAGERLGNHYDGSCIICMYDFKETCESVLSRLNCDHWFHFNCIRDFWDEPDLIQFTCPLCRTANVDWKLHQHAGITPENPLLDVWDYANVSTSTWIYGDGAGHEPHPNIGSDYHAQDGEQLLAALNFDDEHGDGYPTIQLGIPNAADPRDRRARIVGYAGV